MLTTYRFTATLTRRPFSQTCKGTVKVIGNSLDALGVIRSILEENGPLGASTSVKITISPSRKKV